MTHPIPDYAPPPLKLAVGRFYEVRQGDTLEIIHKLENPIANHCQFIGIITVEETGRQMPFQYSEDGQATAWQLCVVKEIKNPWHTRVINVFKNWLNKTDNTPTTPALIIALGVFAFKMMGCV